jgi:arylsulfatase A-like enzyme
MKHVVLITTDQQRADAIGAVNPTYETPNLDALIRQGIHFTGHLCTSAQCTPARATWMTGRYPHEVGVNVIGHMLDPKDDNIAYAFRRHGYETVYFGKWHLGGKPAAYGFDVTDYRADGVDLWGANASDPRYHSYRDAVTTAQALNYLDDYRGDRPFFMHVSWYMPHPNVPPDRRKEGPFENVPAYDERFPVDRMPVPESFYRDDLSTKPPHQRERSRKGESALTEDMVREDARRYRKLVALADRNLGKILAKLAERDLLDDTLVVFTSDHGDMQGAHRLRLKGVVPYKELYNVPLVIRAPWLETKRRVIADLNSGASLANTLLEAAGLPPSPSFFPSLMPLLRRDAVDREAAVFIEHYKAYWGEHPFRGIQTEAYKYVYYYADDWEEMYDLRRDPDERANVAGDPAYAQAKRELRSRVDRWWEETGGLSRKPILDPESKWLAGAQ